MRYDEVVTYLLQNFKIEEVKPYDMVKALGGNISKYTYRRDNNGQFSNSEVNALIDYFRQKDRQKRYLSLYLCSSNLACLNLNR